MSDYNPSEKSEKLITPIVWYEAYYGPCLNAHSFYGPARRKRYEVLQENAPSEKHSLVWKTIAFNNEESMMMRSELLRELSMDPKELDEIIAWLTGSNHPELEKLCEDTVYVIIDTDP